VLTATGRQFIARLLAGRLVHRNDCHLLAVAGVRVVNLADLPHGEGIGHDVLRDESAGRGDKHEGYAGEGLRQRADRLDHGVFG
jgi:hypothetical protein